MDNYICIDIGGTSIKYGVIEDTFSILTQNEIPTEAFLGGSGIMEKTKTIVREYINNWNISGICVSTAGMVDQEKGSIFYANELIPNYTGTKIKEILEQEFSIPCEVENDVNCAALAENYTLEKLGKKCKILLCLTIGTGIGGAIVINNMIYHGFSNSACAVGAMHMGNQTWEEKAATSVLVKNVAKQKGLDPSEVNGKEVFDWAKEGDPVCIMEIDYMVTMLAEGISNLCCVLNPEVVVLGGGIMVQREYLEDKIKNALKEKLIPAIYEKTTIAFAQNGNSAGMLGSLHHFLSRHKK